MIGGPRRTSHIADPRASGSQDLRMAAIDELAEMLNEPQDNYEGNEFARLMEAKN